MKMLAITLVGISGIAHAADPCMKFLSREYTDSVGMRYYNECRANQQAQRAYQEGIARQQEAATAQAVAAEKARKEAEEKARDERNATIEAQESERISNLMLEPKMMQFVYSAQLCTGQEDRTEAMTEIAKEKKYSAIGGVVKLREMYSLQQSLRGADEQIKAAKYWLKNIKRGALGCNNKYVQVIMSCAKGEQLEQCGNDGVVDALALLARVSNLEK